MEPSSFLAPAGSNIVHEDFQDEIIAVNLDTGRYYAFNAIGGWLWSQLARGCRFGELVDASMASYTGNPQEIAQGIEDFVNLLLAEELICSRPATGPGQNLVTPAGDKQPFSLPAMEIYTDMQDLLMLDPIHEVDETGWPHPNPENKPAAKE